MQTPKENGASGEFRGMLEGSIQKIEQTRNEAAKAVEGFRTAQGVLKDMGLE